MPETSFLGHGNCRNTWENGLIKNSLNMAQIALELVVDALYQILKPKCENTNAQDLMVSIM